MGYVALDFDGDQVADESVALGFEGGDAFGDLVELLGYTAHRATAFSRRAEVAVSDSALFLASLVNVSGLYTHALTMRLMSRIWSYIPWLLHIVAHTISIAR